jgi:hypothetical protein
MKAIRSFSRETMAFCGEHRDPKENPHRGRRTGPAAAVHRQLKESAVIPIAVVTG